MYHYQILYNLLLLFASIYNFNYYNFALLKCDQSANFTIHGLWPTIDEYDWPQYCNTSSYFNETAIEILQPELQSYWTSCYQTDLKFWGHEWLKHGTCTNLTEFEYFRKTLDLYYFVRDNRLIEEKCHHEANQCMISFNKDWTIRTHLWMNDDY